MPSSLRFGVISLYSLSAIFSMWILDCSYAGATSAGLIVKLFSSFSLLWNFSKSTGDDCTCANSVYGLCNKRSFESTVDIVG